MHGLIAAAGLSTRLQDLGEKRNKVLLDLGGDTLLGTILDQLRAGRHHTRHRGRRLRRPGRPHASATAGRTCLLNPFFEHYGILGSVWVARPHLDGQPFVFTTGDHYFALDRLADVPRRPARRPTSSWTSN